MNLKQGIIRRVKIVYSLVFILAMAISFRLFYVQWVRGDEWRQRGEQNLIVRKKVEARRGNILAGDGESLLATSLPFYKIAMDPTVADPAIMKRGLDSLAYLLANHFQDRSAAEYRALIRDARDDDRQFIYINSSLINYQEKKKMMAWPIFREGRMKGGVIFEPKPLRYNPFKQLALRTLGFMNESNGGAGLELSFNRQLAGNPGVSLFRRIAGGHLKPLIEESQPQDGIDIETTIDVNLQDVAESALENALIRHQAANGCVALMEVATGEIKAIANLSRNSRGEYVENFNHVIGGLTEPGSTFKLASYMALFEEGKAELEDSVYAEKGKFKIADRLMTDAKPGGYANLSVKEAFEKSSNIVVSKLMHKHFGKNPQKFLDYLNKFGLNSDLDFPIKGYKTPYIKRLADKSWSGTTLPWMSVGYEVLVTPLQTLTFYNAVANNGSMVKPMIVRRVRLADRVLQQFEPEVLEEAICNDETLAKVRQMLEGVVEHGTASNIKHADYKIAGKTGTAQKLMDGRYVTRYYTSFAGYFPADNPKYSAIVVIDNPQGYLQYGADVAAPVFKEVADKVYARDIEMHRTLRVKPLPLEQAGYPLIQGGYLTDLNMLCNRFGISNQASASADEWVRADLQNRAIKWRPAKLNNRIMPNVLGMTLRDALPLLENQGYRVDFSGTGRVASQSVAPGTAAGAGSFVTLQLR